MKILSVPNKENHYALWNWLAENPRKRKSQWPGFKTMDAYGISRPHANCFACIYKDCTNKCHIYSACRTTYWQWALFADTDAERTRLAIIIRDSWK